MKKYLELMLQRKTEEAIVAYQTEFGVDRSAALVVLSALIAGYIHGIENTMPLFTETVQ